MSDGHAGAVVVPREKLDTWLPLLSRLYQFESTRVAGSGSAGRDIRQVLWEEQELKVALEISSGSSDEGNLAELLAFLLKGRQAMRVDYGQERPPRYVSRVAETVRLLGHTYEYWWRGRPGVDAVRWLVEPKRVPRRDIPVDEFATRLEAAVVTNVSNGAERSVLAPAISAALQAVGAGVAPDHHWQSARFSNFQLQSGKEMLKSAFDPRYRPQTQILTAGVGSGKTAAFLIPTIVSALVAKTGKNVPSRTHLLVYPRQALARDQAQTVRTALDRIPGHPLRMWYDAKPEYDKQKLSVLQGVERIYGDPQSPPTIIVLTLETLKRRIQRREFVGMLARSSVVRVVIDEVHLAEGVQGAHVALLMSRLKQLLSGKRLLWTAASATVAVPQYHASRIFNVQPREVTVIRPEEDNLQIDGIAHHVFLRPSGAVSNLGVLVNATSLLVHSRRDQLGTRPVGPLADRLRPKTIGFADSLDQLGRWNADLAENERTETSFSRPHAEKPAVGGWSPRQRELPYALRFRRPLERRIAAQGGVGEAPGDELGPVLPQYRESKVCQSCLDGNRFLLSPTPVPRETLGEMGKIVYRSPHKADDDVKGMRLKSPLFSSAQEVGTLDLCPYLRAGACLWFPGDSTPGGDAIESIEGLRYPRYEWQDVARSSVYSAKSASHGDGSGDDLSELVFRDAVSRIYGIGPQSERIPIDVILASPSLEVGVDLQMLTESIMTKAIRNVASYRQKAGRIGRESGVDALNVTLVTDSPIDLHYYRQLKKLVSLGRLDPIPLKDKNQAVVRSAMYSAIWDWLAAKGVSPEAIPRDVLNNRTTAFTHALGQCRAQIDRNRAALKQILSDVSRGDCPPGSPEIEKAIAQVEDEIKILLTNCSKTLAWNHWTGDLYLSDAMVLKLNKEDVRHSPADPAAMKRLDLAALAYSSTRESIPPEQVELVRILGDLDDCKASGIWAGPTIERTKVALQQWSTANATHSLNAEVAQLVGWVLPSMSSALSTLVGAGLDLSALKAFEEFEQLCSQEDGRAFYLSYTMQALKVFKSVRKDDWFVRPETLFSNPFEQPVAIVDEHGAVLDTVPVNEALYAYIPGTWSYRMPGGPYKIRTGALENFKGDRLVLKIGSFVRDTGSQLEASGTSVPNPLDASRPLTLYRPRRLSVQKVSTGKYVNLDPASKRVMDKDEAEGTDATTEATGRRSIPVKIPRSFLTQWVFVRAPNSMPIGIEQPLDPEDGLLSINEPTAKGADSRDVGSIRHPLLSALFADVGWHDGLDVTEYVTAASRSYSRAGGGGVELTFRDEYGDVAIGSNYSTEGVSFRLRADLLEHSVARIVGEMQRGDGAWTASVIRAFRAYLQEGSHRLAKPLGVFLIGDIVSLVLQSAWPLDKPPTFESLVGSLVGLSNDNAKLQSLAEAHVRHKRGLLSSDEEVVGDAKVEPDDPSVSADVKALVEGVTAAASIPSPGDPFLQGWIRRAILTSFASVALTSLQKYAGSTDAEVGCAINPNAWIPGQDPRVFLFDRSTYGNGSSEVARKYLHVPHVLRHGETEWSKLLPSEDFASALEEELLQCQQFHTDASALVMVGQHQDLGITGLRDVREQAADVRKVANECWMKLGVREFSDAWRLAVAREIVGFLERTVGSHRDDLIRATTICWNGCPECIGQSEAGLGGLEGQAYLDKAVLDAWFKTGRGAASDFHTLDPTTLLSTPGILRLGLRQRLVLDIKNRRLRSMSLPWTLGFEIDRAEAAPQLRLALRTSDVTDLAMRTGGGAPVGMSAMALKRLLWFSLLSSAYLDILGLLKPEDKEVDLISYDLSDLTFDDVGLSPRMLSSVAAVAALDRAPLDIKGLSDILEWLLRRGFSVRVCLDSSKALPGSRGDRFLRRLSQVPAGKLRLLTKTVAGGAGLFHPKALVTPVGAIHGSANITEAGAGHNDELVDFSPANTEQYHAVRGGLEDLVKGAVPWTP